MSTAVAKLAEPTTLTTGQESARLVTLSALPAMTTLRRDALPALPTLSKSYPLPRPTQSTAFLLATPPPTSLAPLVSVILV